MSEIHGAVGSYVIHALDPTELEEFEAHLEVCPTCSREVVEFCETAAELSLLAPTPTPPPALRSSILTAIKDVRPLPPEVPVAEPGSPRRAVLATAPEPTAPAPPAVDELAQRRQRRRTRLLALAVAAVTVVALSMGGWAISLVRDQRAQVAAATLETQLFSAPDVRITATKTKNGGQVSFVSSKTLNRAMLVTSNLPTTDPSQLYQAWTLKGDRATPDVLFPGGVRKQWFDHALADSDGLAITIEPKAGSQVPTLPIQASAKV